MSVITPHPKVDEWSRELASAIVEDMFGDHARQMVKELDRIKFVCSEYLQQFFDASEHKTIAAMGIQMGYDACKDDMLKAVRALEFKKRQIVIEEREVA